MSKKQNINITYFLWATIFFIIVAPISLSYNSLSDFDFGVIHYPATNKEYIFTLPISFFFTIPFILIGMINFYRDFDIFLLSIFILVSFFSSLFLEDFSHLLLLVKITIPILTILGFEIYFKRKYLLIKDTNIYEFIKNSNYKITFVFIMVFIITIISPFYLDSKYDWLISGVTIFDYHQYFPLIFILLLGILASNNQRVIFLIIYILSFFLSGWTANNTFYIMLILFGIYSFLVFFVSSRKKLTITLSHIFIIISILFAFLFIISVLFFYPLLSTEGVVSYFKIARFYLVYSFYDNVSLFEFLTPIRVTFESL